jgi:stearoyl-CoA desaturase (delta-9 desaturase)
MVAATGFSITAGYHRHFSHGSYRCRRFVKAFYLLFGAAAFQHSALSWSAEHRRHHQYTDGDGDPYDIQRGFLWAHMGWLLFDRPESEDFSNVPDLSADSWMLAQHRYYVPMAILMSFGLPMALGALVGDAWGGLLWGGVIRVVVVHHATFCVNSLAHTIGSRPYSMAVSARDSFITAFITFGEGYHNFHHRFAADYRNGVRSNQWDPTKWLIRGMAALGWAYDLYEVPREKVVEAELEVAEQRLLARWKESSENMLGSLRERLGEVAASVRSTARHLGELERRSVEKREELRFELRVARREFYAARRRWRAFVAELKAKSRLPDPQPA